MGGNYKELSVWQKSVELVNDVYLLTRKFPSEDKFGIAQQMERASVSIPSNIAEGHRRQHKNEYVQFLHIALASASELETQLEICRRFDHLKSYKFEAIGDRLEEIIKMLHGLIKAVKSTHTCDLKPHASRGYTLVEILVASTIFVSVVGMGIATYSSASGFQSKSAVIRETNQAARYAMDTIVRDIRLADSSVAYTKTIGPDDYVYTFKGFAFEQAGGGLDTTNNSLTQYTGIKVYRKGSGDCKDFVQEVYYWIQSNTISQQISYYNHTNASDKDSPADYNSPVSLLSGCTVSSAAILSDRVQLRVDPVTSVTQAFFQGQSAFDVEKNSAPFSIANLAPYLKASMDVVPIHSALSPGEESRTIHLETTVTPRLVSF
ncbi:MAG: four helix bundle protein [bacterium]|nr:four helix bundle protein [bacterium]